MIMLKNRGGILNLQTIMKVKELRGILSNYKDNDEVNLIAVEGVDESIAGKDAIDDFGIPEHAIDDCFTIALKVRNDYYMEEVICAEHNL